MSLFDVALGVPELSAGLLMFIKCVLRREHLLNAVDAHPCMLLFLIENVPIESEKQRSLANVNIAYDEDVYFLCFMRAEHRRVQICHAEARTNFDIATSRVSAIAERHL